jgi:chorismate dehydratase
VRLATWNIAPAQLLVSGLNSAPLDEPINLQQGTPHQCTTWLLDGEVDVALLPTLRVLQHASDLAVIPGIGLASTETYPYAQLLIKTQLDAIKTVGFDPYYVQETLLARLLLEEHFNAGVSFTPYKATDLASAPTDAILLVGPEATQLSPEAFALNLGQEWFELTAFPMVWGLFATRADTLATTQSQWLQHAIAAQSARAKRNAWLKNWPLSPEEETFIQDHLRISLDPEVEAGLDAWVYHLFIRGVLDDMPELPFLLPPSGAQPQAGHHHE